MPALSSAADVRAYAGSRLSGDAPDAWAAAAAALRHAALGVVGVDRLSESAMYQTRGRGATVPGVALQPAPGGGAQADVALVLDPTPGLSTEAVARAAGQVLQATWQRLGDPPPLALRVHVVDLAHAQPGARHA